MALVARKNDIAIGQHQVGGSSCSNVAFLDGSATVFSEGSGNARMFDLTHGNCGTGMIIQGSGKVFAEGLGMARLGDYAICFCDNRIDIIITSAGTVSAL